MLLEYHTRKAVQVDVFVDRYRGIAPYKTTAQSGGNKLSAFALMATVEADLVKLSLECSDNTPAQRRALQGVEPGCNSRALIDGGSLRTAAGGFRGEARGGLSQGGQGRLLYNLSIQIQRLHHVSQ